MAEIDQMVELMTLLSIGTAAIGTDEMEIVPSLSASWNIGAFFSWSITSAVLTKSRSASRMPLAQYCE